MGFYSKSGSVMTALGLPDPNELGPCRD